VNSQAQPEEYYICDPPNPLPGSLTVLLPASQTDRFNDLVAAHEFTRFVVRAILSDNIPLSGDLSSLLSNPSKCLLSVNEEPLTLHMEYPGYFPLMYDLHRGSGKELTHIDFLIDTNHPMASLAPARTAVNQLIDVLMRHVWLPLVIVRLDVYLKDEPEALLHQLILPFTHGLSIGPLGGFGSFASLVPYEALLREAIGAASPYYRFLCAYRVLEGVKYLRSEIAKLVSKVGVQERMPRPPAIDATMITGLGLDESFAENIKSIDALVGKFTGPRNALSHFLLNKTQQPPLHVSDGNHYRFYSCGAALLLFYAHSSVRDLMVYFNQHLYGHIARGTKAIFPEDKELLVLRFDAYTGRFGEEEDEEDDMTRPMFIKVVEGKKVEFINISHVVRVEVVHPGDGQPGAGRIHLQDGSTRELGEGEINWVMRVFQGLIGQPVAGTQDATAGYWKGPNKPEVDAKAGE